MPVFRTKHYLARLGMLACLLMGMSVVTPDSVSTAAVTAPERVISIYALANGQYVTAEAAGSLPLLANRGAVGQWEQFDVESVGAGYVALRSRANGMYVCADGAGTFPLVANRSSVGAWETFQLVSNPDGTSSLRSMSNGLFVTAEAGGGLPLQASRADIGLWEKFRLDDTSQPSDPPPVTNPPPALGALPNGRRVGIPSDARLTKHVGDITVVRDGTVIDSLDIAGSVRIRANNVTIRRSIIRGADQDNNPALIASWWGSTNTTVEDSVLLPDHPTNLLDGISGAGFTVRRTDISGVVDGAKIIGGNYSITDSWVHDLAYYNPDSNQRDGKTHNDDVQVIHGPNILVAGNLLEGSRNAAIMISQGAAATRNMIVRDNWLRDGACTVNVTQGSFGQPIQGLQIVGNRFGTGLYGSTCPARLPKSSPVTFTGNVWWSSGSTASPNWF